MRKIFERNKSVCQHWRTDIVLCWVKTKWHAQEQNKIIIIVLHLHWTLDLAPSQGHSIHTDTTGTGFRFLHPLLLPGCKVKTLCAKNLYILPVIMLIVSVKWRLDFEFLYVFIVWCLWCLVSYISKYLHIYTALLRLCA